MRAIAMFSLIVVVSQSLYAKSSNIIVPPKLAHALIMQESSGNDNAIGDRRRKEMAYGCLQIRKPVCVDVNRRHGTNYRASDMLGNRQLSLWICQEYLKQYATVERLGREPTMEDMARIWNGGPDGWRSQSTNGYWRRIQKFLK